MTEAMAPVDFTRIEKWYKGKSLETLRSYVVPTLKSAMDLGYWPKGAARKVHAALNKQNVAVSFARSEERNWEDRRRRNGACAGLLSDITENRDRWWEGKVKADYIVHDMMYGHILRAPEHVELASKLEAYCVNDKERTALSQAREWAEGFAPVAKLVLLLDSRRPIPTLVCKTLSPTVLKNVGGAMGIELDSIEAPEIEYRWEERTHSDGTTYQIVVPEIKWPKGIRHNASRFAFGTKHNDQCHACGHAIKSALNWVPLVAKTPSGPVSLWVGRDCAKKLFGCEVAGEADWAKVKK